LVVVKPDRYAVISDGVVVVADLLIGIATIVESISGPLIEPNCGAEIFDGVREVLLAVEGIAAKKE
jgi:hypothetical protein